MDIVCEKVYGSCHIAGFAINSILREFWVSAAGLLDWLWAGRPRGRSSNPGRGKIILPTSSRPVLGFLLASCPMGTGACFFGVKRPEREADNSAPTSIEVKTTWIYTSTFPYVFMA
jgi:hypothetical protein